MNKILTATICVGLAVVTVGCQSKQDAGVLTGGALGALVGSRFGGGTGQVVAITAGAIGGALIGGAVGQSMDQVDQARVTRVLEMSQSHHTTSWRNPDTGYRYSVTPTRTYHVHNQPCREYTTKAWISGKQRTIYGKACRQADGSWKVVH